MSQHNPAHVRQAKQTFDKARQQAKRERFFAWLYGKPTPNLIPFEKVAAEVQELQGSEPELRQIPLDMIIGSIGRYEEFTTHFLPLKDSLRDRWIGVAVKAQEGGWPPIQVYQVFDGYWVVDGNHRVAVARQMGNDTIEAYVTLVPNSEEIDTNLPLDQMLVELGRRDFLALTKLDETISDHNIVISVPARYRVLSEQVLRFRKVLEEIDEQEKTVAQAAVGWYEMVYAPTALLLEMSDITDHVENRTVADLFVWMFQHRKSLRQQHGEYENWGDLIELISADFAQRHDSEHTHEAPSLIDRAKGVINQLISPDD